MGKNSKKSLAFLEEDTLYCHEDIIIRRYLRLLEHKYPAAAIAKHIQLQKIPLAQKHTPYDTAHAIIQEYNQANPRTNILIMLIAKILQASSLKTSDTIIDNALKEKTWHLSLDSPTWSHIWINKSFALSEWLLSQRSAWASQLSIKSMRMHLEYLIKKVTHRYILASTTEEAEKKLQPFLKKGLHTLWAFIYPQAQTLADIEAYLITCHSTLDHWATIDPQHRSSYGLSIKLSHLSPRFEPLHEEHVLPTIFSTLCSLVKKARALDIPLMIEAEELYRLPMTVRIITMLLEDPLTDGYTKLGCTVQAYTKIAPSLIEYYASIARSNKRKLSIRLVKGAYWHQEYTATTSARSKVFSHQAFTNISYIQCIYTLLEHADMITPIFATHDPRMLIAIQKIINLNVRYALQFYYGQGDMLAHTSLLASGGSTACCIYTPIARPQDAADYIVERLCDVTHAIATPSSNNILQDAEDALSTLDDAHSSKEILPSLDFSIDIPAIYHALDYQKNIWKNYTAGTTLIHSRNTQQILSTTTSSLPLAVLYKNALDAYPAWSSSTIIDRKVYLQKVLTSITKDFTLWVARWILEAGMTWDNAGKEVQETLSALRYIYNSPIPRDQHTEKHITAHGVWHIHCDTSSFKELLEEMALCLLAGNTLIITLSPHLPLIARDIHTLFLQSGMPSGALHIYIGTEDPIACRTLLPHSAGYTLISDNIPQSHDNLSCWNKTPCKISRPLTSIIISDPTCDRSSLIDDILDRLLSGTQALSMPIVWYCHNTDYDITMKNLSLRLSLINIASSERPESDYGPMPHESMATDYLAHITWCEKNATFITCCPLKNTSSPLFVSPTVYALKSINQLPTKSIGPVLYVIRYTNNDLESIIQALHLRRHESTLSIYSTLQEFAEKLQHLSSYTAINCRVPRMTKQYTIHTTMTSESLWQPYIMEQKLYLPSM